jgi:arylsulfatase A-like enzyme/Tfp pilus assembly protein PilF
MRKFFLGCLLGLFPAALAAADQPNVILVTLDTVRADRMGFLGSKRGLTPNLDALAHQSVVFERAYSQAPLTPVSHAAILTGTYPQFHLVHNFGNMLGKSLPYLPDLLRSRGYRTAAFVSSIILDPWSGFAPGFERGFDVYDAGFHHQKRGESRYGSIQRRAADTLARALPWLEKNGQGRFFLWIHLWDAHDPYDPPEPFRSRLPNAPYDADIAYLDAEFGKIVASLKAQGLYDKTLVATMSDHGEALGDHGEKTHGVFLYDETIRVPLLFKLPGEKFAGQRVKARVSLLDVAPTILDLTLGEMPSVTQGQSLVPMMGVKLPAADRTSFAESQYTQDGFGWSALKALRTGNFLYVKAPQQELYDVTIDPAEKQNLAATNKAATARYSTQVDEFVKRTSASASAVSESALDPKDIEKLTALGYVAANRPVSRSGSMVDPKTKIEVANKLHDANIAIGENRLEAALGLLQRVVASDPQIYSAQYYLGVAYARLRNFAKAVGPLHKAIELRPDSLMAHYEMGLTLYETGDWKTAAVHFEIVVKGNPEWVDAVYSLGSIYARIDRVPEAEGLLAKVLEKEPDHYRANLLLGRLFTLTNEAPRAISYLEKAVKVQADSAEANAFLADAYERLGRVDDAAAARSRAAALRRKAAAAPPTPAGAPPAPSPPRARSAPSPPALRMHL